MEIMYKQDGKWHIRKVETNVIESNNNIVNDIKKQLKSLNNNEQELFEERAALMDKQFYGSLSREEAEKASLQYVLLKRKTWN